MNSRILLKGAGCGVLLTLCYVREILGPSHWPVYFHRLPLTTVFLGVLVDLIAIGLAASLAWAWIDRLNPRNVFWPVLMAGVLLLESHSAFYLYTRGWSDFSHQAWAALGVTFVAAGFVLRSASRIWFDRAMRAISWSLVLCGFPILVIVPELLYMAAQTSGHESVSFSQSTSGSGLTEPRICWILFDELSHYQVYEHRAAGLNLPNFDRLHRESAIFTNVRPAGDHTNIAIPSMFLGRPASQMRSSATGDLSLYSTDTQRWERFDASKTIFADARRLGWTSGIVGWANPYCRFMQGWVDDCYWVPEDDPIIAETNMKPNDGVVVNAASMPLQWLHALIRTGTSDGEEYNRNWVAGRKYNYSLAMERAQALIRKSSIRLEFIHLPVPHPPAIYDRKTQRFSDGGSYLDNLALADVALGKLLDQLEKTSEWPKTTLIVSGDHSLRPWIWQRLGFWTPEDEAASGGNYDPRPALTIHLPGQLREYEMDSEFQAFELAGVLGGIMRDRIHTPDDLWAYTTRAVSSNNLKPR